MGTSTLVFPGDRIVGSLEWHGSWNVVRGPILATAEVEVPDDRPVSLIVRNVLGVERQGDQWSTSIGSDPVDLAFLAQIPAERIQALTLNFPIAQNSVPAVQHIAAGLRRLCLSATMLTDSALPTVAALTRLTHLQTWGNCFSERAIQQLAALVNLESLYLEEATLSAAALSFVDRLPHLRRLGLQDISITDEELASLRARMSHVRVSR